MGKKKTEEPTQKTTPKKGAPIEIPVPKKSQIMTDFEKIATSDRSKDESESDKE
ncbi:MAG TPA: hypothetical protein VMS99_03690 [Acidimicrobiia bacterium]|nr:hypothetical protein [Acidimicrobiia bacterium]